MRVVLVGRHSLLVATGRSYKHKRPIPDGSPGALYPAELRDAREHLDALRFHHVGLSKRFLHVAEGDIYEIDLVYVGVMIRSYGLVDGFLDTFDMWNPVVAAPLLRMQLDNLVRLSYMAHAPSADEVARHVVGGGEFRGLKDPDGKRLIDARLLEHAEPYHPWVRPVYEATSGWVHFSPAHVRAGTQITGDDDNLRIFMAVPLRSDQIPLSMLQELVGAMIQATEEVFAYVEVWEQRKGLPLGQIREPGLQDPR